MDGRRQEPNVEVRAEVKTLSEVTIRPEKPEDLLAIRRLVQNAFDRDLEANLVEKLRESDGFIPALSLVAVNDDEIVGHIMITSLEIATDNGESLPTTILAPLAVLPTFQNQGIGSALTRAALDKSAMTDYDSMILVGHPNYYRRFGFRPASARGIRYASEIPDDVFMAIELVSRSLSGAAGLVTLPPALDGA